MLGRVAKFHSPEVGPCDLRWERFIKSTFGVRVEIIHEHPIPESLGNDDWILPPGCVCDQCNLYFGTKIEKDVLTYAPFGLSRVTQAVKSKAGKYPLIVNERMQYQSTGYWDGMLFRSDPPHDNLIPLPDGRMLCFPKWAHPNLLVRFFIKMGIECLLSSPEVDFYHERFNAARRCARYGDRADGWDFAMGLYPDKEALIISEREDEFGPLVIRQIYSYGGGIMHDGDVHFNFMYERSYFCVNLSGPSVTEYIIRFNTMNSFAVASRWKNFPKSPKPHLMKPQPLRRRRGS